jgi:hypothetical protein
MSYLALFHRLQSEESDERWGFYFSYAGKGLTYMGSSYQAMLQRLVEAKKSYQVRNGDRDLDDRVEPLKHLPDKIIDKFTPLEFTLVTEQRLNGVIKVLNHNTI